MKTLPLMLVFAALATSAAHASTATFTLGLDACTGTCGTGPFATVTLTDNGAGASAYVTVTEALASNEHYAKTGAGSALEFNLTNTLTGVTLTNFASVPTGTTFTGITGASASAFGSFGYAAVCSGCANGGNPGNPTGLSFEVHATNGVTVANFITNTGGYYFASDILGNNGNTGNVATSTAGVIAPSSTPEPGSVMLSMIGLGLVFASSVGRFKSTR